MRFPQFHYRWEYHLPSRPDDLWPLVSDTNRFNRDSHVPAVTRVHDEPRANARQRLRMTRLGLPIEWEEEPFEWVRPSRFGVARRYLSGPVAEMRVLAELQAIDGGGTRLTYQVWARPRTLIGMLAIPIQIGLLGARTFRKTFARYSDIADSSRAVIPTGGSQKGVANPEKLAAFGPALVAVGVSAHIAGLLVKDIDQADELSVSRIRPYVLADVWGAPRRAVLEACLEATRLGLLELRWDVLCPLCRGAKETFSSLEDLGPRVHCDVCNIEAGVNLERFVEVTFRPNPAIRAVDVGEYCVGGPQVTPHIVVQQLVKPGEERELKAVLEPGRYRIRTLSLPGAMVVAVDPSGEGRVRFEAGPQGWTEEERVIGPGPTMCLRNLTDSEQLFIIERTAWSDQAATGAEVIVLQRFRDLFSREALRPQQPISVGSLAILFTDLRGSTRLYREIGDAPAFGLVMDHFDILRNAVAAEGGTIVKTIGDAVMAAFLRPAAAIRTIVAAQRMLATRPADGVPVVLKAGVHYGPCIAVTLNERLDYFGSTVNIASRLEAMSDGGDIVVSSVVQSDADVQALIQESDSGLTVEAIGGTLKGLETEEISLWRITIR